MAVDVRPTVTINGKRMPCHASDVDTAPTVIRGFQIHWGRSEYQSNDTSPASVKITILDTTGTWAKRIRESTAIGQTVEISWTGTATDGTTIGPVTMYRGRVAAATAKPHHYHTPDNRRGWAVELTCADRTAEYGNAFPGPTEWPAETMILRANRIRDLGLAAGSAVEQVYFWPGYVKAGAAPLDVKGKSALELMRAFFESMGNDSYAYDPHENVVRQAIRLSQAMSVYLATFDDSRGAVLPVASDIVVDDVTYPGIGLGGCELAGEPEISATSASDINRLECTWADWSTGYKDHTTVKENIPPGDSRRVMAWDSWLDNGGVIDPTMENVWNRARQEGRRPRHPDFTVRPGFVFTSGRLARWILQTWENTRPAFIAGNLAYQWLMDNEPAYPPIVAPIGGTTAFDPILGWAAEFHVHWIHNETPATDSATWQSMEQIKSTMVEQSYPWWFPLLGIPAPPPVTVGSPMPARNMRWGDAESAGGYHWDPSVTWGDTRHIPTTGTQIKDVLT